LYRNQRSSVIADWFSQIWLKISRVEVVFSRARENITQRNFMNDMGNIERLGQVFFVAGRVLKLNRLHRLGMQKHSSKNKPMNRLSRCEYLATSLNSQKSPRDGLITSLQRTPTQYYAAHVGQPKASCASAWGYTKKSPLYRFFKPSLRRLLHLLSARLFAKIKRIVHETKRTRPLSTRTHQYYAP